MPLSHELTDQRSCAFIATRQTEVDFTAETLLEFNPRDERDEAGISDFKKVPFHYDLFVTRRNARRVLLLRKRVGDMLQEEQLATLPAEGAVDCVSPAI